MDPKNPVDLVKRLALIRRSAAMRAPFEMADVVTRDDPPSLPVVTEANFWGAGSRGRAPYFDNLTLPQDVSVSLVEDENRCLQIKIATSRNELAGRSVMLTFGPKPAAAREVGAEKINVLVRTVKLDPVVSEGARGTVALGPIGEIVSQLGAQFCWRAVLATAPEPQGGD